MITPGNSSLKQRTVIFFVGTMVALSSLLPSVHLAAQQRNDSTGISKQLDDFMVSSVAAGKFNGSVLIAQKGKILLQKGYGWKNFSAHTSNDSNSISPIGSLTKPFTAIIILKLQEEGKLSVNDKLSKYIPEQKDADKISIQNLLNHTSGIYDFSHDIPENDSVLLSHPVPKQKVLNAFLHRPLEFKPGARFSYCNSDYFLLGLIIEKVTGMPYWQAVHELILAPLGMNHSGFDFINLKDTAKATGYKVLTVDKQVLSVKWDSTVSYSAGALYSTTGDLYKWGQAIGKRKLLGDISWKQALRPNLEHYGDGWWIDTLYGKKYIYHSGGLLGFMSDFMYYPDDDVAIIMLNNFGNYGQSLIPINHALSAIVFHKYIPWESRKLFPLNDSVLRQFIGTYTLNGKDKIFITLNNHQLYAESSSKKGIPRLPIYAENENSFFLKDFDAVFTFIRGADDSVDRMTSHENGKVIEFRKIK